MRLLERLVYINNIAAKNVTRKRNLTFPKDSTITNYGKIVSNLLAREL